MLQAEVYENSMQLLHGFQRGHVDAQETSMRRIEFLEKELDQAKSDLANSAGLRQELLEKQAECRELTEALEELEAQQSADTQRAVEAASREWQARLVAVGDEEGRGGGVPGKGGEIMSSSGGRRSLVGVTGVTGVTGEDIPLGEGVKREKQCEK